MLNDEEITKLRGLLESAQNPLFFFDNDADGLCSFLIFQRSLGRGKGVPIKSYPSLSNQYLRKVDELHPDAVFILDKAEVSTEFIDGVIERNLPIVWVDHHKSLTAPEDIAKTEYFNTYPESEPVTFVAQHVFKRDEDLWLGMIGCIADVYSPDFGKKFAKQYPEMYNPEFDAFKALHATEIGKFALMCNFGLMNSTTNVIKLIRFLERAQGPYDLLEENYHTYDFHKRYKELYSELERLMNKAKDTEEVAQDVLYFKYGGPTSMSAILSSKLYFENPDKLIVVAYKRPEKINLSIRGKNALEVTNKIVEKVDGATGGGHPEATGAMIPALEEEAFEGVIKNLRQ